MNVAPVATATVQTSPSGGAGLPFGAVLAAALDAASSATGSADGAAASLAAGGGDVIGASLVRAKADVLLEVVAVTASRASSALTTLLQTQV